MPEFFPGGLVALDKQGMSIATYPVIGSGPKSLRDRDYFQLAIASGKTIIGKPRIGQISRNPLVSFASPVRGRQEKFWVFLLVLFHFQIKVYLVI